MQWIEDWLLSSSSAGNTHESAEPASQVEAVTSPRHSPMEIADIETISNHESVRGFVVILANDYRHLRRPASLPEASASRRDRCKSSCCQPQAVPDECDEIGTSRAHARSLESCGRGDYNQSFIDLRSASQARKRNKSISRKYYGFKYVKPGDLEASQRQHIDSPDAESKTSSTRQPTAMDKTELYRLAQLPPRPPQNHHRHIDKVRGTLSQRIDVRRENRKHSKAIINDLLYDCDGILGPRVAA